MLRREATGAIDFQYGHGWLDWRGTFPVSLSLPLREERCIGTSVINVFDNLLPDNDAIRNRIAERVGAEGTDAFSLLTALGQDCVGALQFLPDGTDPGTVGGTDGKPVSEDEVAYIIKNLAAAPLGMGEDEDFRISIAGAQEKTALLRKDGHWFKPTGTTATTHILKPQIGELPNGIDLSNSVENEYLCLKLLEAMGVPTANVEITDFGERRTLIVERFDRLWTKDGRLLRLPQEDMPSAVDRAHQKISVRRRPWNAGNHQPAERQRHTRCRYHDIHARKHPVLAARRNRRSRQKLQYFPWPWRTLPNDASLRCADRTAKP